MLAGWYGWSVKAVREEVGWKGPEGPAVQDFAKLDVEELRRLARKDPAVVADVLRLWLREENGR